MNGVTKVDSVKRPYRQIPGLFRNLEHQVGDPSALSHELLSRLDLVAIVSDDESNKNVLVIREHIVGGNTFGWLASHRESIWRSARHLQSAPDVSRTK